MTVETAVFTCSICGEPSKDICSSCTKDACSNHRCERCKRCSDCCECEVPLSAEAAPEVQEAAAPMEQAPSPVEETAVAASVDAPVEPALGEPGLVEPALAPADPEESFPPFGETAP